MEVLSELELLVYFFTLSTHNCVFLMVPVTVALALICKGDRFVEPLEGEQMLTPGELG